MSFKDTIRSEGKKTHEFLKPYTDAFKEAVEGLNSQLQSVTDNKVDVEFGAFLRKALGNVNGTAVMKPIEREKGFYGYGYGYSEKPITGVAVGKKFGFRIDGKTNNYYIDDDKSLLIGLTGLHVDLIKRDSQRVLARDFYAFKSAYYRRYDSLYKEFNGKVYAVNIPVKVANMYKVTASGDDGTSANILDDVFDGAVTSIQLDLPEARWIDNNNIGKTKIVWKSSLRSRFGLDISKPVTIIIKGKIGEKEINFPSLSLNLLSINTDMSAIDYWFVPDYNGGLRIMNMTDVINNKFIQELIKEHLNYNKGVAKTFEYLRLKYAKNLIMNGEF